MTKEDPTSSTHTCLVGGTRKPYAPFGAPRLPRSNVMSATKAHPHTCDSQSLFTDGGTGRPYAPLGAPRHSCTFALSAPYGHAGNTAHATVQGSPPHRRRGQLPVRHSFNTNNCFNMITYQTILAPINTVQQNVDTFQLFSKLSKPINKYQHVSTMTSHCV